MFVNGSFLCMIGLMGVVFRFVVIIVGIFFEVVYIVYIEGVVSCICEMFVFIEKY